MKVKMVIDEQKFINKPQGKEIGWVVKRMTIDKVKEYSIEELKQSILDGRTNRPSNCGGKEESWLSQQVFMIDIDNDLTIQQAIKICNEAKLIPNFIYTSFSHKEEHHKFRLVFVLDKEITDFITAKKIQLYLMSILKYADKQCKNLNRPYFAGKSIVFESDNILDSNKLIELSKDIIVDTPSNKSKTEKSRKRVLDNNEIINIPILSSTPKLSTPESDINYTIKAISKRDIKYLKNKYGSGQKIIFETKQQFLDYIRKEINLGEFLEFHYPKSIRCIFHDDNNKSASIFQANDGAWIYNCFGCGVSYNIIGVIERLAGFQSRPKTYKFIKEIFNLEIMETEWQKAQKEILLENLDILNGDMEFLNNCPQANKNIKRIKHYLERLIYIAMKNIHNEELTDDDGQVVFFASGDYICKEMGISPNSLNKIYQKIAFFTYHKLVNKLDDDSLPERFLKRSQAITINHNGNNPNTKIKHVNFFSIPSYNVNRFPEIEQRAEQWKENHYTMKGISREMFFRGEGLEIANEIYPQYKKVTETIEGKNHVLDRTTTKSSDERTNNIVSAIHELIQEQGFTTEKEIVKRLRDKYKYTTTEVQIKKSLKEICDNYNLTRIRANKKIKEQFGVVADGYPFIIVKNDALEAV